MKNTTRLGIVFYRKDTLVVLAEGFMPEQSDRVGILVRKTTGSLKGNLPFMGIVSFLNSETQELPLHKLRPLYAFCQELEIPKEYYSYVGIQREGNFIYRVGQIVCLDSDAMRLLGHQQKITLGQIIGIVDEQTVIVSTQIFSGHNFTRLVKCSLQEIQPAAITPSWWLPVTATP